VEYNEVQGGSYGHQDGWGCKANSQAYMLENMIYRHNLVYYTANHGLSIQDSKNALVEYNTVYTETAFGAFYITAENKPLNVMGNIVRNNIFVGSAENHGAIRIELNKVGLDWRNKFDWSNNLIFESNGAIIKFFEPTSTIETHKEWRKEWLPHHPDDIHTDPLFVNFKNRDFRLKPKSPAIGKGYTAVE
jgi:hypothetical protein